MRKEEARKLSIFLESIDHALARGLLLDARQTMRLLRHSLDAEADFGSCIDDVQARLSDIILKAKGGQA